MPSGVSHGSALPAGTALAVFSKRILAKFGMRLMVVHHSTGEQGRHSLMVRMLVADDAAKLLGAVILQRGLARQIGDADHPAEAGFGAVLPGGDDLVGPVEGAGHDLDPGAVDAREANWGPEGGEETGLGIR